MIKTITSQHRSDFSAIMICEHCGAEQENKYGYDDHNYHHNVIPNMKCGQCGKSSHQAIGTNMDTKEKDNGI